MGPADTRNLKPGDIRNPDGVLTDLDTGAPERSVRETVERQDRAETLEEIRDLVESSLYVKRGPREARAVDVLEAAARMLLPGVRMELSFIGEDGGSE